MGYKEDGEDQGRRRTRSGARPAAVASPPPAKKEKKTPKKTPKATPGTGEWQNWFAELCKSTDPFHFLI